MGSRAKAQRRKVTQICEGGISARYAAAAPIRQGLKSDTFRSTENSRSISVCIRKRHLHDANIHTPTTSVRLRHRRMLGVSSHISQIIAMKVSITCPSCNATQIYDSPPSNARLKCGNCANIFSQTGATEVAPDPIPAPAEPKQNHRRPTFLSIITIVGPILLGIGSFVWIRDFVSGWRQDDTALVFIMRALILAAIPVFVALRAGKHWAWVAIQVFLAACLAFVAGQALSSSLFLAPAVVYSIVIVSLWFYIRSGSVAIFCSAERQS